MQVKTRYFFAGGRARWPLVKLELYLSEACSTFFWCADIFGWGFELVAARENVDGDGEVGSKCREMGLLTYSFRT